MAPTLTGKSNPIHGAAGGLAFFLRWSPALHFTFPGFPLQLRLQLVGVCSVVGRPARVCSHTGSGAKLLIRQAVSPGLSALRTNLDRIYEPLSGHLQKVYAKWLRMLNFS
jgi:hypothetical protein